MKNFIVVVKTNGSSAQTVGHGLSSKPEMIIMNLMMLLLLSMTFLLIVLKDRL